jgi:hypothetical protein
MGAQESTPRNIAGTPSSLAAIRAVSAWPLMNSFS